MKEQITEFKAGELMTISTGEYSDYCVNGLFSVLKDFDAQVQLAAWAAETGREMTGDGVYSNYQNKQIDYMGWLNRNGFVEDVTFRELHIGDYGETELSDCTT